jgi:hypothetical protein
VVLVDLMADVDLADPVVLVDLADVDVDLVVLVDAVPVVLVVPEDLAGVDVAPVDATIATRATGCTKT